ncbi:DUF427 domain-containing protein [Actinocorallia herbida]|uniref:DUF427 domain-containing protein n=1 Tax=Actinocorallia herbida TaxID=58109 RepID=UPI001FEB3203|nr:DUF427 domain-containing protein [Actinocorallia herbida]
MGAHTVRSKWTERPDYRVDVLARTNVITATVGGVPLARSAACLIVDEQDHGLAVYFPPDSIDFSHLEEIGLRSVCPFKGEAVYWRAVEGDEEWVAWSYPDPFPEVARIAGYLAFDQDKVTVSIGKGTYTGTHR